jgi:excisionase family DNA binding protein
MRTPPPRPDSATRHAGAAPGTTEPPRTSEPEPGPAQERLAYSVDEAASLTGLSRDLLYDQMRRGNLPYIKVGRRRLITRQHLEQFLDITPKPAPYQAGHARS